MLTLTPLAIMAAVAPLLPSALATFDASANTNMAVYWGQGPNQKPLEFFCDDDSIDIIQIGFVNVFPDQSGGYPGTNFGNQCGSDTYKNINGSSSLLLSHCPGVGSNITYCQSIGKKVLLSLGGAIPNNQHLKSDASAVEFATFLWEAFGPEDTSKTTPRPFGNAVIDGFDFDIENVLASGEDRGDLDRGYGTMVNTLRTLYDTDKSKPYYVSAAPQCIVPDAHLADAIETSPFDFLFIQFYNTQQCSARAYFDHSYGGTNTNISFASWVDFVRAKSYNPKTKVYLGLPAAPDTNVVYDLAMYLQPNEANEIIKSLQCEYKHEFGGVMIYEATSSQNNQIHGQPYADVLKGYLENTKCAVSPPVTSSATVHSTSAASSTHAVTTTYAVSTTHASSSVNIASSSAVVSSSTVASSNSVSSSRSTTAVVSFIPTSSGKTSASISNSGSSLPAISTGSSIPTSSGEVVVSVTEVSTVSSCPPNVSYCPFRTQTAASIATSASISVHTPGVRPSSSATAVTSSVPAPTEQGTLSISVGLSISTPGSKTSPSEASGKGTSSSAPSVNSSGALPSGSPSSLSYLNATSAVGSSAPVSIVTQSTTPILSGTTASPVPESTEYTSLTTYTTVTSCPVTTTKVQGGKTSIIVETSLITSTVTTCPRCSEKTISASVPSLASMTPGSPGEVGTTVPAPVPSNPASPSSSAVLQSSPTVVPGGQSTGPLPSPTTYTTTEIVSTLTTTCSEATTFSLSPSGKVYTATANETLTIYECPCTLTHKTTGYSVPTNTVSPSQPLNSGVPPVPTGNANVFSTGTSYFGTPKISEVPSKSEAGESNSSPNAGSSSPSYGPESSTGGKIGSSSAGSTGVSNPNTQSKSNSGSGAAIPSVVAPSVSKAGTPSESNGESGVSSPGSGNKAAGPQQPSPKQSTAQVSPSEAGAVGSVSKAGSQALASVVTGVHLPVVTMEIIPVPQSPSQTSQSGNVNQKVQPSGQPSGPLSGQENKQENEHQGGQSGKGSGQQSQQQTGQQTGPSGQSANENGQQSQQQTGQQSGQSGQQIKNVLPSVHNGTAPVTPSSTVSASPSVAVPASGGTGSASSAQPSPQQFKGAAGRVDGSLFGVIAALAAAILLL